jgi:peroxiredoxin
MLEVGTTAPPVALQDSDGNALSLTNLVHHPHRAALLYFMRSTTCPICNHHVRTLIKTANDYTSAGVQTLIAVPEDPATAATWKSTHNVPFQVLTGPLHEQAGLTRKFFGTMQQSGTLLIDSTNTIRHTHATTLPTNSFDKSAVAAAIATLQSPTHPTPDL